jgi:TolB-like protein/DNA-binding winged helix-turn-helix (wHTH) protein/Flp pilus assembly protein TadD
MFFMQSRRVIWYEFDNFRLEVEAQKLLKDGVPVTLSPKNFQTLLILVEKLGETVGKDVIYNKLWADSFVEEGNLTQHIYVLRKSLGESPSGESYIETVSRHGYRFKAEVKKVHAELSVENQVKAENRWGVENNKSSPRFENYSAEKKEELNGRFFNSNLLLKDAETAQNDKPFNDSSGALRDEKPKLQRGKLLLAALLFFSIIGAGSYFYFIKLPTKHKKTLEEREIKSIAVLPFKTIGEESESEHLGLGMTDAIITRLSQLKQIPVRPTSAVFRLTEAEITPVKVGQDLQVDAVLEGTVQRGGNWVRVSVQLIKVDTGETIWAEKFDGEYTHIFRVQDKISEKVVDSLALNLSPNQEQKVNKGATENTEAYQAYVLGIYFWNKRTKEGLQKAEQHFQRAIELDPNYAQAYAGLADTYNMLAYNRFVPLAEVGEKAKSAALKAIELDDTIGEAHMAMAQVQFAYEKNEEAGIKSLERAIELSPYNATTRVRYGWRMMSKFELEAAEREMRLAQIYDPLSPINNIALCNILIYARKYDEAVKYCEKGLEIDRGVPGGRITMADAYLLSGKNDEAVALVSEELRANPGDSYSRVFFGVVYAYSGNIKQALEIASKLSAEAEKEPFLYADLALISYFAGRKDEAFENLNKAIEKKAVRRMTIVFDPKFDEIKKDPRFSDLIKQHGITLDKPSQ